MEQKKILFIGLFLMSLSSFSQYTRYESPLFKRPEATIIIPKVVLPEDQMDYQNLLKKSLKKKTLKKTGIANTMTETEIEFDKKGNIINEIKKENPYVTNLIFTYKKDVLIEKRRTVTSDSVEIKRLNENIKRENQRESQRLSLNYDETQVSVVKSIYEVSNKTSLLYKAVLDKKNHVISYGEASSKNNATNKSTINEHQYDIIYDEDKIIEIHLNSDPLGYAEHYFYDKNLLLKRSWDEISPNSKTLENKEYLYDKNNNLIVVKRNRVIWRNDKIIEQINKVEDSAVYNENNKVVWVGNKERYSTFKYNNDNAIIEQTKFYKERVVRKEEFFYDKNLIIKAVATDYYANGKTNVIIKTYNYNNGILKDYEKVPDAPMTYRIIYKYVYEYDDTNQIKKITDFNKVVTREGEEHDFIKGNETNFTFTPNSITITNKNGESEKYEFY